MKQGNLRKLGFHHIRCFNTVVRTGSFSEAAKTLNTAQPALSRIVKELEDILDIQLIIRSTRPIKLTLAGQVFHDHSKTILRQTEIALKDIQGISRGFTGVLRLALSDDVNVTVMSDLLAQFREKSPEIEIQFTEINIACQLAGLRKGDFDAGFARYPIEDSDIKSTCIYQEELVVVLPKRHPLLERKTIDLEDFLTQPLIYYHPRHVEGSYKQISKKINLTETKPNIIQHAKTFEFMLSLVSAGFGISMMGSSRIKVADLVNVTTRPFTEHITLDTYLMHPELPTDALKLLIDWANTRKHCIKAT